MAREGIAAAGRTRDSPSTGARVSNLCNVQTVSRKDAIYNGRPPHLQPTPIAIYHEVFAKFTLEVAKVPDADELSTDELRMASSFLHALAEFYKSEGLRAAALAPSLSYLLSRDLVLTETSIHMESGTIRPDGVHRTACIGLDPLRRVIATSLIVEKKNEVGTAGCDPMSQAECAIVAIYCSQDACLFSCTVLCVRPCVH